MPKEPRQATQEDASQPQARPPQRQTLFLRREKEGRHYLRSIEVEPGQDGTLTAIEKSYAPGAREETKLCADGLEGWLSERLSQHREEGWQPVVMPRRQRQARQAQGRDR